MGLKGENPSNYRSHCSYTIGSADRSVADSLSIDGQTVITPIGITGEWVPFLSRPNNWKMVGMSGWSRDRTWIAILGRDEDREKQGGNSNISELVAYRT